LLASLSPKLASLSPKLASLSPKLASLSPKLASLSPKLASLSPKLATMAFEEEKFYTEGEWDHYLEWEAKMDAAPRMTFFNPEVIEEMMRRAGEEEEKRKMMEAMNILTQELITLVDEPAPFQDRGLKRTRSEETEVKSARVMLSDEDTIITSVVYDDLLEYEELPEPDEEEKRKTAAEKERKEALQGIESRGLELYYVECKGTTREYIEDEVSFELQITLRI